MKAQGATARTNNAVMGRAYKETFDGMSKEAEKGFHTVERSAKETFHKLWKIVTTGWRNRSISAVSRSSSEER